MPRSNDLGPRTARELQRAEERIRGLKYEWKSLAGRLASAGPSDAMDAATLENVTHGAAATAGFLRSAEDMLRAARALVLGKRLVMPEDKEGER